MEKLPALRTSPSLTYQDGVKHFLLAAASRNLTEKTIEWYTRHLLSFQRYFDRKGEQVNLKDIAEGDIREFLSELLQKRKAEGRSDYSVRRTYDALKIFFTFLHRESMVFVNVMTNISAPRTSKRLIQPLTQEEVSRLLSAPNKKTFCGFIGKQKAPHHNYLTQQQTYGIS